MKQELKDAVQAIRQKSILVLGDMVADIYIEGKIARISREAPVLVLEQAGEKIVAGGAANVVHNIAALGGQAYAAGVLGEDKAAQGLRKILRDSGAEVKGLVADKKRPTIAKTRIIAGGRATVSQQIVRLDKESHDLLPAAVEQDLQQYIDERLPFMDGVVLSDYGSGTVTQKMTERIIAFCRHRKMPLIVDSRYAIRRFAGVSYIKQNDAELAAAVGRSLPDETALCEAGQELLHEMEAEGVLITRGEKGMVLFLADGSIHDIPVSNKSEVYDVSGAGDTCVATVILALAAGIEPVQAAEISNIASGIAVRKLGTAAVQAEELVQALS